MIKGKTVPRLVGIDKRTHYIAVVTNLFGNGSYRARNLNVAEDPVLPHEAMIRNLLLKDVVCAHHHALIVDAVGKCSSLGAGKRDDRELAVMQQEPKIGTVAIELPGNVSQVIYAGGNCRGIGKAWDFNFVEDPCLHHKGALSVSASHVKRTDDDTVFVDVLR